MNELLLTILTVVLGAGLMLGGIFAVLHLVRDPDAGKLREELFDETRRVRAELGDLTAYIQQSDYYWRWVDGAARLRYADWQTLLDSIPMHRPTYQPPSPPPTSNVAVFGGTSFAGPATVYGPVAGGSVNPPPPPR